MVGKAAGEETAGGMQEMRRHMTQEKGRSTNLKCALKSSALRLLGGMKSSRRLTTRPFVRSVTRSSRDSFARKVCGHGGGGIVEHVRWAR